MPGYRTDTKDKKAGTASYMQSPPNRPGLPKCWSAGPSKNQNRFIVMTASIETNLFANRSRLKELRVAHRDLDVTIEELNRHRHVDQIRVTRLKKQKLALKDMILRLESEMIPNLNA